MKQIRVVCWEKPRKLILQRPRRVERPLVLAHVHVCAHMSVCGNVYLDGIEKSWWLGPCIKGLRRGRTASGSNNVASNPSLPQRPGPGWQPRVIFTTLRLLLTSLHFTPSPFHSSPSSLLGSCLYQNTRKKERKKCIKHSFGVSLERRDSLGSGHSWNSLFSVCAAF